ncbi:MAG: 16S rRNA (cytidine(1402)-2'-O)-methyltransferase [Bacteroidales bacterium]|nr:16S rRNA (cytidine(1402)-2'-O)-methyltransferase [Bacteroidales bacterium]
MSKLFIVPTPIGNLEDVTFRALRILKEADYVLAEDTRTSRKFFNHYEIDTPLRAYHMHNEHAKLPEIIDAIQNAGSVALISDAGTPAISDPGFLLVREAIKNDIDIECLPGATAFVPALVNSGLPNERFIFEGFLPHKKGRQGRIKRMAEHEHSFILYESPHRLIKTLNQLAEFLGADRQASISREISKMFEETKRGTLTELVQYFDKAKVRGEFVIIVAGKDNKK